MRAFKSTCQFCGMETGVGNVCQDCYRTMQACPLKHPICSLTCPYKKQGICDYPFIGRIKAEPDKKENN